jgi:hypothetical protein
MLSAHNTLHIKAFAQENFPNADSVVVPPLNSWAPHQKGHIVTHDTLTPTEKIFDIPAYDQEGHLAITFDYSSNFTTEKSTCLLVSGPFSRKDISLITSCLLKKSPSKFNPTDMGLRLTLFDLHHVNPQKLDTSIYYIKPAYIEFIPLSKRYLHEINGHLVYTMNHWRPLLTKYLNNDS